LDGFDSDSAREINRVDEEAERAAHAAIAIVEEDVGPVFHRH